jgi:NarL family two-component system response regulator LiaR
MANLTVVAVDDHKLMLEAIRAALADAEGIEVVGEAISGSEALPVIARTNPDVVLLDLLMPHMDGLTTLGHIRKRHPDVKVMILSAVDEPAQIQAALEQGAISFIVKRIDSHDLAAAIREAAGGAAFQTFGARSATDETAAKSVGITDSELRVLRAIAEGLSNKQIAEKLVVTEQTVKFHLTNIYRKLDVSNRTEAARYAYQHGLASNPFYEIA